MNLSANFTLAELTRSARATALGIDNTPPPAQVGNLRRVAALLEQVRAQFGPWVVSSGYRSPALNGATPGSSSTSAHPDGRAADGVPAAPHTPGALVEIVAWVHASRLDFDQVIYEAILGRDHGLVSWVHLGVARVGASPRREALMTFDAVRYMPFDAARIDPVTGGLRVAAAA